MGNVKDNLKRVENEELVTLSTSELVYLQNLNGLFQSTLDRLQQEAAAQFLKHVAVERFEYDESDEFSFNLDIQKATNNLKITKLK